MKEAKYFLAVRFAIEPQTEAQVLRWLDGGHAAEVAGQPGFLWCRRINGGNHTYMMLYGIETKAAFMAYESNSTLKKKFADERAPFENHMKIERFHGEVAFSI
jgi:antibiotic biosynthesis monooxygenase (ABM) superfamily enzyme